MSGRIVGATFLLLQILPCVDAQELSAVELVRIPIEKRWDHPVPSVIPEVRGVLKEGVFYANSPNHPTIGLDEKAYTPLPQGGFRIENGKRYFNRPLFYRGNMVGTGDRPMFLIARGYGKQWAAKLRFAVSRNGSTTWLDEFPAVATEFFPGEVTYRCTHPSLNLTVQLTAAASLEGWTSLFRLEVTGPGAEGAEVRWVFGDVTNERGHKDQMWWLPKTEFGRAFSNEISLHSPDAYRLRIDSSSDPWKASLSEIQLRTLEFYAGSRWRGQRIARVASESLTGNWTESDDGNLIVARAPVSSGWTGTMVVAWGGEPNPANLDRWENEMKALRLPWGESLFREWKENFVGRGSEPRASFEAVLAAPEKALASAREFWNRIGQRIVFDLEDKELQGWANWLVATQEYLHWPLGQMASLDVWGQRYLHISNMYSGWDYLGVHDQQEAWLRLFATSVRNGWIGLYHGVAPWAGNREMAHGGEEDQIAHYVNYVYTHWLWTANKEFVRDVWPAVKQLLEREIRQNDSDGDGLFASRYPYWGPENDSWGPKTGLQSGQMLRAMRGASALAAVAGDSAASAYYAEYAVRVEKALPQLWSPEAGLLGWRDPLGVLHLFPGAQETFLPILRDAVKPIQAYQMLRFVRENLWSEVHPGVARIWLNANLGGRQALGPLMDVAWSTLSAAGIAGAMDVFYPVLKTYAHSYFFSSWPGGEGSGVSAVGSGSAGMNDHNDGRMPALYFLGRGLFGLEPDIPNGRITIEPRFPSAWNRASIRTPDLSYTFAQSADVLTFDVSTPRSLTKTVRLPVRQEVVSVSVDGKPAKFRIEPAVNRALAIVELPLSKTSRIVIATKGPELRASFNAEPVLGAPLEIKVAGAERIELLDPQKAFASSQSAGSIVKTSAVRTGDRTAFLKAGRGATSFYLPVETKSREAFAIAEPRFDSSQRRLSFRLENRAAKSGRAAAKVHFAGATHPIDLQLDGGLNVPISVSFMGTSAGTVTRGSNPIEIEIEGVRYRHEFIDWAMPPVAFGNFTMLDLSWDYHEEAASLFNTKFYYDAWQMGVDYPVLPPATYEWAGHHIDNPRLTSTRFLTTPGIPFYLATERKHGGVYQDAKGGGPRNILPVANWRPGIYPSNLVIPASGRKLSKVYFLAYSWQRGHKTYHPNVELIANYADGSQVIRQLVPPYSFMPQYGLNSSNENPYAAEVVDSGLVIGQPRETKWYLAASEDSRECADIYDLPLDPGKELQSIEVRSVATESLFAIFGITFAKPE